MIPKDVAGRELKVGQKVAHTERAAYRGLTISKVAKVTEKMVQMDDKNGTRRAHGDVCIVEVTQ